MKAGDSPPAESPSLLAPGLLASARDLAFVLAILAFFTGFEYRYYYYQHDLHVPTSGFPFVDNAILAASYSVFKDHADSIANTLLVILLIVLLSDVIKIPEPAPTYKYQRIILFSIVLASFPILNVWAQQTASKVAFGLTHPPAPIAPREPLIVSFKQGNWSRSLKSVMMQGCVEFIFESSDTIYALVKQRVDPIRYVIAIPVGDVDHWITPLDYSKGFYAQRCIPKLRSHRGARRSADGSSHTVEGRR